MSGIYIHIPFCKQACHYCDFHFSTSMSKKESMLKAIQKELKLRKNEFKNEKVETIYFGGGTPSILETEEINEIIKLVYENYEVTDHPEITLEANPDDLSNNRIIQLSKSPVNRLSIGIQSFFDQDLKLMNRVHNAREAEECIRQALKYFYNISIDLIYGIPYMDTERWKQNIEKALSFNIPHISSYALTVEPKTALKAMIDKGVIPNVDDEMAQQQFHLLVDHLENEGYIHYEISNFGKPNYFSQNNTAYWLGKNYIGIGPSAHSYDGKSRRWNVKNNPKYLKAIHENKLPLEIEVLSKTDRYNEYIMTGLRTIWGVSLPKIKSEYGEKYYTYLLEQAKVYMKDDLLAFDNNTLLVTKKGKFLVDGIAADLFLLNLEGRKE